MLKKLLYNYQAARRQTQFGFGTGARPQKTDNRDHLFASGAGLVDWDKGFDLRVFLSDLWKKPFDLPTNNQDGSLSCVGQSWAKYAGVKNYVETGVWVEVSPHDIYSNIALPGGGAYGRDGGMFLVKQGAATEDYVPSYMNPGHIPPDEAFMRIKPKASGVLTDLRQLLRVKEIQSVSTQSIDTMAQSISLNHGTVFAVKGENNGTWFSLKPKVGIWEWSHFVYGIAFKVMDGKKYIGIKNSWGEACGEGGVQWLGQEWFDRNMVFDGWTATDQANYIDRQADFELFSQNMWGNDLPEKDQSPYNPTNWNYLQSKLGIYDISQGQHYDYEQVKKLRAQYNL